MSKWCDFTGYDPHPGQLALHLDPRRFRCLTKGRRGGGTTAAAFEAEVELQLWSTAHGESADIGLFAPTVKKTEMLFSFVYDSLITKRRFGENQIKRHTFAPGNRRIETTWGSRLVAWSLDEKMPGEGWGLRLAIVDEAQGLTEKVWWESVRPTLSDTGGRALFVGKAAGATFRKLCGMEKGFPDTWGHHRFISSDNPIVTEAEVEEAREQMPRWMFEQEYLAIFADFGDQVFSPRHIEAAIDDELPLPADPKEHAGVIHGWDLARKVDFTVGCTLTATEPHTIVDWWRGNKEPWPRIERRIRDRFDAWGSGGRCWIDATGLGDVVVGNLDLPSSVVEPYVFTKRTKEALITNLQTMLEHGRIRFPRIPQLVRELEEYEWNDEDLETDCVMALALAAMGVASYREPRIRSL